MNRRIPTLDEALYIMGHESKVSFMEAATRMGISHNTLYRKLSPNDAGANLQVRELVPAMRAFENFLPLKVLGRDSGCLVFRPPRGRASNAQELAEYQMHFAKVFQALAAFIDQPTKENYTEVIERLWDHLKETASWKVRCEKDMNQLEMEFEERYADLERSEHEAQLNR